MIDFTERPPNPTDAKQRRRVQLVDGTIGVLSYVPVGPSRHKPATTSRPGRATVVVGGRFHHPTVDEIAAVETNAPNPEGNQP